MMKKSLLTLLILLFGWTSQLHAEEELLQPDKAFAFQAVSQGNQVQLEWNIAERYYLYRDKIKISTTTPGVTLGALELPKGKIKKDEFFGDVAILRNRITTTIKVTRADSSINTFALTAKYQGCADLGVCYPPITKTLNLTLAGAVQSDVTQAASGSALSNLGAFSDSVGASGEDEVLEADQAFQYQIEIQDPNTLIARWQIAPDHYMYRDKIKFTLVDTNGVTLGQIETPAGEEKHDEFFGDIEVYHHQAEARIPLIRSSKDAQKISIKATYQGCAELTGICYPPIKKTSDFNLPVATTLLSAAAAAPASNPGKSADNFVPEQDKSSHVLKSGSIIEIMLYFFLGGLALAFTACMYPMIPILSSIIVGHGDKINRGTAFTISMAYVQSMAVTFGILGAAVALFAGGVNLQAYFQSPWILIPFAILFVALAFSMFGFYTIQMPASVQGWLSSFSNKQKGGTLHGAIFMGAASALIIGPCAGPVIIGALAFVATEHDWQLGFLSMFILGNGLGLPLLAVGTFGGHVLPKAGTWMDTVKAAAGVILLAIALLFLERISFISATTIMLLWATLFIVSGIYMGALQPVREGGSGWHKLWKGLGLVFVIYGAIVMLGGLTGARNFNDPLHGSSLTMGGGGSVEKHLQFKRIKTADDLKRELEAAKKAGKYVMLDFYADWCTYCKQFEDYVFNQPDVQELLKDFVLLQADVTDNDEKDQGLSKFTSVQAPPAILFFDKQGKEIKSYRIVGAMDHPTFMRHVQKVLDL